MTVRSLSGDRGNRRGGSYHRCDDRSYENEYDGEFVMNHVEYEVVNLATSAKVMYGCVVWINQLCVEK